jgi:hypothetical protein
MVIETLYGGEIIRKCTVDASKWTTNFFPASDGRFRFVYCTRNLINNMVYVGQHTTDDLDDDYIGSGKDFNIAVEEFGRDNFKSKMLCFCEDKKELDQAERYWIAYWEACERGYNIAHGGTGGDLGPEVNKKISEALKGKPLKDSVLEKFRDGRRKGERNSMYGKTQKKESIEKGKETFKKNYKKENHPFYNKPQTDEHKRKNSEAQKHPWSEERKIRNKETRKKNGTNKSWNQGRETPEEVKLKISISQQNLPIQTCIHCGYQTKSVGNLNRWHNDNCKQNPDKNIIKI